MSEVASVLGKEGAVFWCLLWDDISITGYVVFGCGEVGTSVSRQKGLFSFVTEVFALLYFAPLCNGIKANFIVLHGSGVISFCTYCY